jgi:hypothetical protein
MDKAPRLARPRPVQHDAAPGRRFYSLRDLAAIAWEARRVWLVALAAGVALGAAACLAFPADATASAVVLIEGASDATMRTELAMARSEAVARETVEQVGPARVMRGLGWLGPWLSGCAGSGMGRGFGCALAAARSRIDARLDDAARGVPVLRLTAAHPDAMTALAMLDAALSGDQILRDQTRRRDPAGWLAPPLASAERDLAATLAEAARVRQQADVLDLGQDMRAASAAAATLAAREREVRARQAAVDAQSGALAAMLRATPARVIDSHEMSSRDAGAEARATLLKLRLDRAHLAELYAPNFIGIVELDRKIETVEATLRAQPRALDSVVRDMRNPTYDMISGQIAALQGESAALARQSEELARQAGPVAARVGVLREASTRLEGLRERQQTQETLVRQLTLTAADLRAGDAASAGPDSWRVLQPPRLAGTPPWGAVMKLAAGAMAGLLVGAGATGAMARRRRWYVVGREVERHLGVPELACIDLEDRHARDARVRALAGRVVGAMDGPRRALHTVHLVGTAEHDGGDLLASLLAEAMADIDGLRVLLLKPGRDGDGDIRSLDRRARRLGPGQRALTIRGSGWTYMPAAVFARVLLGAGDGSAGPVPPRISRLRRTHDVILVMSCHGVPPDYASYLSSRADLSVLVVAARDTRAEEAARLHDGLTASGARPLGFVFTTQPRALSEAA